MTIQTFAAGQTLTASQMNTLQASDFNFTRNVQTGTAYTLVITDRGKLLEFSNAGAVTLTVPTNAAVAFEIGDRVDVLLTSNGSVAIVGASGVTIAAEGGITTISSQWTRVTLIKRTTDDWVITGGSAEVQTAEIEDSAITEAKIATGAVTSAKILNGTIVNEDISDTAAIADSKLATISTGGKVANSATSASDENFGDAIVARDASGDFAAGTITADLIGDVTGTITGNVTGNLTGNVTGNLTGNVTGNASGTATYTAEWTLGANGTANYLFAGPGLTGSENDPTIYLTRGQKYKFINTMGSHPFRIQSTVNGSTGTAYSDGVTNNDVSNGTLIFDVQFDAPSVLYYQCTSHANMGGKIYIVNEGVASDASVSTSGTITATGFVGPLTGAVTGNVTGTASNSLKIDGHTVFVQQSPAPTALAVGDIWFQLP